MQHSETFERELRDMYAAIVAESFARARHCLGLARRAQQAGNCAEVRKWVWSVRVLRMAAGEWRNRAQRIGPVLACLLWCLVGCAKGPPRDFTAHFEAQPLPDGTGIIWTLSFNPDNYYSVLDSAPDGTERAKVRELIAEALTVNHLESCSAVEKMVIRQKNGEIAFIGSCHVNAAHGPASRAVL